VNLLDLMTEFLIVEDARKIIQKYNLGKGSRVRFKNDEKVYYVERVAEDGITVFVKHEPTNRIFRKQIFKLAQVDGKAVANE
jgi:hypothetical protein